MGEKTVPPISDAERRRFESSRDQATMQLLFKAARLANERALAQGATAAPPGVRFRPAHTALLPHLDFDGVRLTELARRAGVTKQAVGPLVDDLAASGVVERIDDLGDGRAKRIRFSRRGYAALMHGLDTLRGIEASVAAVIGARRMRDLHDTLNLMIAALEAPPPSSTADHKPSSAKSKRPRRGIPE